MATSPRDRRGALRARAHHRRARRRPGGLGALVALSLLLRTTRARDRLLDRRGPVGRDRRPPAGRHPARAARGRLAAAVLHAAALLARHRGPQRGRRARAQPAVRAAGDPGRVVGRAGRSGARSKAALVRGRPGGLQPVPGAVRAGGADVLAGRAAGDPGDGLLPRAPTRSTATGSRRPWIAGFALSVAVALYTHNWPIFFTIAAAVAWALLWLLARQAAPPRAAARRPARLRRRCSCSTCRGCRRRSTRPPTPARRGRTRRPSTRCSACPACCSAGCRRSCC